MSISLQKGQKVSLSKDNAGLSKIIVGLGWDEVQQSSSGGGFLSALFGGGSKQQPIDCDASALMLKNGKLVDKSDIVYFGNLHHKSGCICQFFLSFILTHTRYIRHNNLFSN